MPPDRSGQLHNDHNEKETHPKDAKQWPEGRIAKPKTANACKNPILRNSASGPEIGHAGGIESLENGTPAGLRPA